MPGDDDLGLDAVDAAVNKAAEKVDAVLDQGHAAVAKVSSAIGRVDRVVHGGAGVIGKVDAVVDRAAKIVEKVDGLIDRVSAVVEKGRATVDEVTDVLKRRTQTAKKEPATTIAAQKKQLVGMVARFQPTAINLPIEAKIPDLQPGESQPLGQPTTTRIKPSIITFKA